MIRLYIPEPWECLIPLSPAQSHYLVTVMRRPSVFCIFNETRGEYLAHLEGSRHVRVKELRRPFKPLPFLGLAIAVLKPKAMQFVFEKATELGVTDIFLLETQHGAMDKNYSKNAQERFHATLIEASEQCERMDFPIVHPPVSLKKWLETHPDLTRWCVALERSEGGSPALCQGIVIGPEGGFSESEQKLLTETLTKISLGPFILRAETAAIVGLSRLQGC